MYWEQPSGPWEWGYDSLALTPLSSLQAAISLLKQEYKDEPPTLDQALDLAVKVLYKTLDSTKLNSEKGLSSIRLKFFVNT